MKRNMLTAAFFVLSHLGDTEIQWNPGVVQSQILIETVNSETSDLHSSI